MTYSGSGSPLSSIILFLVLLASFFLMLQSSITSHRAETVYEYDTTRNSQPKATILTISYDLPYLCGKVPKVLGLFSQFSCGWHFAGQDSNQRLELQ